MVLLLSINIFFNTYKKDLAALVIFKGKAFKKFFFF